MIFVHFPPAFIFLVFSFSIKYRRFDDMKCEKVEKKVKVKMDDKS